MSSPSHDQNSEVSDSKLATERAPAGMNSITNTVGAHPTTNPAGSPPDNQTNVRHGCCDNPNCTDEHSGKQHE